LIPVDIVLLLNIPETPATGV